MSSPRYFGFVIGGSLPAALAADWLTSTWDQNVGLYLATPAAAVVEEVAGAWLVELLGLPAGRRRVHERGDDGQLHVPRGRAPRRPARVDWDVEDDGPAGAPPIRVDRRRGRARLGAQRAPVSSASGAARAERVPTDDEGRMVADALARLLDGRVGPTIVCAQLGEVNTGAFDPIGRIVEIVRAIPNAWLHVDGAFGLWAAASPRLASLFEGTTVPTRGRRMRTSGSTCPTTAVSCFVRDGAAHRAAMGVAAAYLPPAPGQRAGPVRLGARSCHGERGGSRSTRRIRELGRDGIAAHGRAVLRRRARMAARPGQRTGRPVLNEVVLNQVLVSFDGDEALTRDVIRRVQPEGTAWMGGTTFHGVAAMRISVSEWTTTDEDADRTVDAIIRCLNEARAARATPAELVIGGDARRDVAGATRLRR